VIAPVPRGTCRAATVIPRTMSPPDTANGHPPRPNGTSAQMRLDDLFGHAPATPPRPSAPAAVAQRLKSAREAAGHETASAAALAFGWAPSRYLAHESGERPIAAKQVALYAAAFGVDPAWLQSGAGESGGAGAPLSAATPPRKAVERPSDAMLRAARQAIWRIAVARGLVPAAVPADQALELAETWRELADAAVNAAWQARG
jgi:hypothetical protein